MAPLACSCCGDKARVVLNSKKGSNSRAVVVCGRCDLIKNWPSTIKALRR